MYLLCDGCLVKSAAVDALLRSFGLQMYNYNLICKPPIKKGGKMLGERLKAARLSMGLTQRELAGMCDISAMAISKYERNLDMPSSGVLLRLAKALESPIDYFFRPLTVKLSEPMYRCRPTFSAKQKLKLQYQVQEWLERYLEVESLLPSSQVTPFTLPPVKPHVASSDEVEQVADNLRKAWKLGLMNPIENLIALLEDQGVKVGLVDAPDDFDACVMWANESIPVMVVKNSLLGDRQRFSLAHELGHIALKNESEKAAYRFAAAFLAPREAVFHELGPKRSTLHLYELHLLKQKYGLSMQGWIKRSADLGILSISAHNRLQAEFRSKGWNLREPGDQLPAEKSTRMKRLVVQLLVEDVISASRAAELLGQPLQELWKEVDKQHDNPPL